LILLSYVLYRTKMLSDETMNLVVTIVIVVIMWLMCKSNCKEFDNNDKQIANTKYNDLVKKRDELKRKKSELFKHVEHQQYVVRTLEGEIDALKNDNQQKKTDIVEPRKRLDDIKGDNENLHRYIKLFSSG